MQRDITRHTDWSEGFISGLVCGEGNFTIAVTKARTCRLGYHVRPLFQVEMGIVDEGMVVAVRDFFGFGCISRPSPRTRARNESPTIRYTVTAVSDCSYLESFFRKSPLVGAKRLAFESWSRCLSVIKDGRHTTTDGFREIINLRSSINQFRRPSTYRDCRFLETDALPVVEPRPLVVWSKQEKALVLRYLAGKMSRAELIETTGRSTASVANQIKRLRQKGK